MRTIPFIFSILFFASFSIGATSDHKQIYSIAIHEPADHATLQNTGGEVTITISSSMSLTKGDKWIAILDGEKKGEPQTENTFTLQNIERGEHTLQIQAINSKDEVLGSSSVITIYVHQTAISQK